MRLAYWLMVFGWMALFVDAQGTRPSGLSRDLQSPFRLTADGKPIEFRDATTLVHAAPAMADIDSD